MDVNMREREREGKANAWQKVILMDVALQHLIVIHAEEKRSKTQIAYSLHRGFAINDRYGN